MTWLRNPVQFISDRLTAGGRPLRFLIAGGINTLFGLLLFPALLWTVPFLHRHFMIGLVIAQAVCLVFAFATYKLGVFRTRANIAQEFGLFSSFYLVCYALNLVSLPILVHIAKIDPVPAQIGFTLVLILGSYFWHNHVTFRSPGE